MPKKTMPRKMMNRGWIVVALAALASVAAALELDLPAPPAGYAWRECPSMKGAVLVPTGWHFTSHQNEDTTSYFITRKAYQPGSSLGTGMSIDVLPDIPGKSGAAPSTFAAQYMRAILADKTDPRPFNQPSGSFQTFGAIFNGSGATEGMRVYTLLIANDATGTVFALAFQAPNDRWDEDWAVASPIFAQVMIDDTV